MPDRIQDKIRAHVEFAKVGDQIWLDGAITLLNWAADALDAADAALESKQKNCPDKELIKE